MRLSQLSLWQLVLAIYLVLLTASHIWRGFHPDTFVPGQGQETVLLKQVAGDSILQDRTTRLAYSDSYTGESTDPPVLLLLHGSPVGSGSLPELIRKLAADFRVIAPDFPGYNASDRSLPDYSMEAYSMYMRQLMDSLGVGQAHIAGYSMGGGISINMSHNSDERVASITLISSIGVQELELMGSYHLNHYIHGVQLALLWILYEGVPHFGQLNNASVNIPYARSYFESDLRPMREYLQAYRKPMLILHGTEDPLVPLAAAQEHHRIVPQSRLELYPEGGGTLLSQTDSLASDISRFIHSVVNGTANHYSDASVGRILEANRAFGDVNFARFEGLTLAILLLIIMLSTFFSEDLTCIGAGLLVARGIIGFWPATAACFTGIVICDVGSFFIAKMLGRRALDMIPFKWIITEKDIRNTAGWFESQGPAIIVASRFIPGSRFPTYVSAGIIGAGTGMFLSYFVVSLLLWTPLLVAVAMVMGTELLVYFEVYQDYALWVIAASIALLFLFLRYVVPGLLGWRGEKVKRQK